MALSSVVSDQARSAEKMYNVRAASYNDSWHPPFAADMVKWASIQPTDKVLDLACGTGLVSLAAAQIIRTAPSISQGHILGVDIADSMLSVARAAATNQNVTDIITFIKHDITQLDTCSHNLVAPASFDIITNVSCIPLLSNPRATMSHWATYLKPGGRLIVDVITPESQIPGLIFEQSAEACGANIPWGRLWIRDMSSVTDLLEAAGLQIEKSFVASGYRSSKGPYFVNDGEGIIDRFLEGPFAIELRTRGEELKARVKEEFLRRWDERAKEGIIDEAERFYIVIGRKPRLADDSKGV